MIEFLPGRVWAASEQEAREQIAARIQESDRTPGGTLSVYPCLVQPRAGLIWWEYYAEVR